eukprot:7266-Heterococcus_DN1.PRE.2
MELCTGGAAGRYTEVTAADMTRKMLKAITHCHKHSICHRDLKAENWVFESTAADAELKLIDFGLSRHFSADEVMHVPVGTPYSIAPEVLNGSYTSACDLWSLGVLTYMLLTGKAPFDGQDDYEVLEAVKAAQWSWPCAIAISSEAKDFVGKLLVLDTTVRMTAQQAMAHTWLAARTPTTASSSSSSTSTITASNSISPEPIREMHSDVVSRQVLASLREFEHMSTLKKLVLQMVAFTMEPWQVAALRREFEIIDTDCNGMITMDHLSSHGASLLSLQSER